MDSMRRKHTWSLHYYYSRLHQSKVSDHLCCESLKRIRKRSKIYADYGKDTSTDSTFRLIVKRFRRKVNSEVFGSEDSDSPGQKNSGHGNGFAFLSDDHIDNPFPPPEPSNSLQPL